MAAFRVTDWQAGEVLGRGSFATVYKAQSISDPSRIVAIKVMEMSRLLSNQKDDRAFVRLANEIKHQIECKDAHTVPLYEVFTSGDNLYLVMELCWGDLAKLLSLQGGRFSEEVTLHFMKHLALGLKCLHTNEIVHRDLKPQNLLITSPIPSPATTADLLACCLKISDFGFARILSEHEMTGTLCGSPLYMAPELLNVGRYTSKADLWSAGAIMLEMLTGQPPYPAKSFQEIILLHRHHAEAPVPLSETLRSFASPACISLLTGLLAKNTSMRITFTEFFTHPWFNFVEEEQTSLGFSDPLQALPAAPGPSEPLAPSIAPHLDTHFFETLRSIERVLPSDDHAASLFEDQSSFTQENLSKIVDRIASLSREYEQLKREKQRQKIIISDLLPGDRVMFFYREGTYHAYGRFPVPHVLSIDSHETFESQIRTKTVIFGLVVYLTEAQAEAGNPYALQPSTQYVQVVAEVDPFPLQEQ